MSVVQSDNCTDPSLNQILRNAPQGNVTGPNESNKVTVFGNLHEEIKYHSCMWRSSVLPPVLLTLPHISAPKTAFVTSKKT